MSFADEPFGGDYTMEQETLKFCAFIFNSWRALARRTEFFSGAEISPPGGNVVYAAGFLLEL